MKNKQQAMAMMKYTILIYLLLSGCTMEAGEPVRDIDSDIGLERIYDSKHNIVCYKYANNRTGLSCVKIDSKKETAP